MNNCVFDGRLARDAELKDLGENKVCNFSIGSNVGFGDKQKTIWLDCSIWGRRGESLNDSLKKGQQVFISGELSTREYEKDGVAKTALSLNVQSLAFGASSRNGEDKTLTNSTELNDEIPF